MAFKTVLSKIRSWRWLLTTLKIAIVATLLLSVPDAVVDLFGNAQCMSLPIGLMRVSIALVLAVALVKYYSSMYGITWKEMGIIDSSSARILSAGISATIIILVISYLLSRIIPGPAYVDGLIINKFYEKLSAGTGVVKFLIISSFFILAACEELVYRGLLMSYIKKHTNRWTAIILSSLLFTIGHIIPQNLLPIFMYGIVFGLSFEFSGAIWAPIVAHGLVNLLAVSVR